MLVLLPISVTGALTPSVTWPFLATLDKMKRLVVSNLALNIPLNDVVCLLSSGKTTLLLALAGKLGQDLKVSGRVTYNGHEMNEFVPQRTAAYISQNDVHIEEMTVRETLAFSARCQRVGSRFDLLSELTRREIAAKIKPDQDIDIYMKILDLEICADTLVGDEMLRRISERQRKRVTTGTTIRTGHHGSTARSKLSHISKLANFLKFVPTPGFKPPKKERMKM
ncbi:hypothetical protein Ahy_B06g084621 [Arachis hypogaea]|uniref:ABC transporter domain-containing protein n=1 Tax=Arachis hypogaea TaxID=3818 RepID=A0A444YSD3_ARAHY|nr:hypothetical protein Ahy_B06g084621 [Arachis hypogaea]